jgi:hypothetical protein
MGDGTRLAIAIAVLFLAGVAFFFAFHPNGVQNATNPDNMLEWLMTAFQTTAAGESPANAVPPTVDFSTTPVAGVTPQPQPGVSV